ncbi:MAG: glutamine--tRNA ligase/YqeY domain fusion protein [Kiritimatiellia bacterium]|jgi:glutaminyl-tRNA synthetase|nr:glutamine--tRNA ligase/YqeY domain fusion protein [Kiritimatiellia bacterium]MDP6630475.1 glutamine--tRNA ligase/YqeY domain fusion protein [Kiritimatiellia bacterium]MDP6809932.1 glutamine--tRNA ligase/YqeY domain fusion protein [Kiritimatiellia bacterium]MDP7025022.1 glutamine--tRNA ligase/YqeY domain fusion protein [Kiritimatiellia bacterium]
MSKADDGPLSDFIRDKVADDLQSGKYDGRVVTRFPPEPNGYLHIGHAKAICLDFGIAEENSGECHLRFDDTNPEKEDVEYVDSIMEDVRWLGFDWGEHLYYASDYFEQMVECALKMIRDGKAYVCDLSVDAFKEYRGVPTRPGKLPPGRDRSVEENLDLFERMRAGEFEDGSTVLRAKIDMASPNLHMRDPALYRIKHATHHRTGDTWCIYPTYDFAHGLEDSIERVTHSLCTLEFEVHRPLYDWLLEACEVYRPEQTEFSRLNLTYTVMSKRKLLELVEGNYVSGWDDPRMPTLCGLRRRGYTPDSIRRFCRGVGITKVESLTDISLLEHHIKDELNQTANRVMAVLDPIKLVIDNYPEDQVEELEAINNPEDESAGTRTVPFSRELWIEREDFREEANRKYHRLTPGREVRLRYAYFVTCTGVVKDETTGEIKEVHCTYDPDTRGGDAPDGRRVKGTIHWVCATRGGEADVRLYDRLFSVERPASSASPGYAATSADFKDNLNPDSLRTVQAKVEPAILEMAPGSRCQFERKGYFFSDPKDSSEGAPVFNQIVPLRDSWRKRTK